MNEHSLQYRIAIGMEAIFQDDIQGCVATIVPPATGDNVASRDAARGVKLDIGR
jgi:hypothetical protein